jgi:crossover junction endodeoxyribonuclease RuvC
MFVLGIDPGLSRCGYGCVTRTDDGAGYLARAAGVITTPTSEAVPSRLSLLRRELSALLDELQPQVMVIERIFFRSNARTAMSVGQASGVALLTAAEHGCRVAEYTAAEVKLAVAGYGGAPKEQVQAMVGRLLQLSEVPQPADVADALALGICHLGAAGWERQAREQAMVKDLAG